MNGAVGKDWTKYILQFERFERKEYSRVINQDKDEWKGRMIFMLHIELI